MISFRGAFNFQIQLEAKVGGFTFQIQLEAKVGGFKAFNPLTPFDLHGQTP